MSSRYSLVGLLLELKFPTVLKFDFFFNFLTQTALS